MFYLVLFIVCSFLFAIAEVAYPKDKRMFYLVSYISIFLLSLFAGLRDVSIGTDTTFYGVDVFKSAAKSKSPIADAFIDISWIEPLFFLLNRFASYFGGFSVALFFIMFVQLVFAFHGLKRYMNKVPLWVLMLAYVLLFYNLTLNLMRQGIALAFVLYCLKYVDRKKLFMLLLMSILGFLWHKTSAVAFIFLFYLYFFNRFTANQQQRIILVSIPLVILIIVFFLNIFDSFVQTYEMLAHYRNYGGETGNYESGISTIEIGSRFLLLCFLIYVWWNRLAPQKRINVFFLILFLDTATKFLSLYTFNASRLSIYFAVIEIPYLFMIVNSYRLRKEWGFFLNIIIMLSFTFMTYWETVHYGHGETYPYVSKILNLTLY